MLLAAMAAQSLEQPSPERLMETVRSLSALHTRHSLSPGVHEAATWLQGQFAALPGCKAELMRYVLPAGRRIPEDTPCVQVVAVLPGQTDDRVLIGGHLDSLNLAGPAESARAPGANDDASGVAVALECARLMAGKPWRNTLVFVGFTGEEQGLHGARALARRATDEHWRILGVLNNDTVGCSANLAGQSDKGRVRVFSDDDPDSQSRELARYAAWIVAQQPGPFRVKLVLRRDRFGRGGDHTPFAEAGFPAVRFIEAFEEYSRQHTEDDLAEHVDPLYLSKVAAANLAVLAALANAAPPPAEVRVVRDQAHSTTLEWQAQEGVEYGVYWRDTASAEWQGFQHAGAIAKATIHGVNKDDHVFAVGALPGVPVEAR
jgi:Zn-dependent M28 family amino/carboxypeptidase